MDGNMDLNHHKYYFRLFSRKADPKPLPSTGETGAACQIIDLRSPSPLSTSPGFVVKQRPSTHYFTGSPAAEISEQYRQAALAGEEIMKLVTVKWVKYFPCP
jgi:hypothetical protein